MTIQCDDCGRDTPGTNLVRYARPKGRHGHRCRACHEARRRIPAT